MYSIDGAEAFLAFGVSPCGVFPLYNICDRTLSACPVGLHRSMCDVRVGGSQWASLAVILQDEEDK